MKVRAIDLFSGAGGSSWGAHSAGIEVVAAFDRWDLACLNYSVNFPETRFFNRRLEYLCVEKIADELGHIDLILASPECTNHSPAKGNKPRCEQSKNTAFQVVRFARVFLPRWLVIENVINMKRWSRYSDFKAELAQLGYHLQEATLDAQEFGVPQTRRRLFLLGDRLRQPEPVTPASLPTRKASEVVNLNGLYQWSPVDNGRRAEATLERAKRGIETLGPNVPFLLVYYGSDGAGGWQRLDRPLRTITTLDRFALVKPSPGGHVMRMLQVPELQAAMGMDGMMFRFGSRRDRIKMIGNAVCPPVMRRVVESLMKTA